MHNFRLRIQPTAHWPGRSFSPYRQVCLGEC